MLTKNLKVNLTSAQDFCIHLLSVDQDARYFSEEKFSYIACVHDLYSSPNIVRVVKSRRMRWAGHVARMGEGG
jgi:hypothetical protein